MRIALAWMFLASFALGQPPKSEIAVTAKAAYDAAIAQTKTQYLAALTEAAKSAIEREDFDEIQRITNERTSVMGNTDSLNPADSAAKRLFGTRWTYNRPKEANQITFHHSGAVSLQTGQRGRWAMVDTNIAAVRFGDELFVFTFDEKQESFTVVASHPVKSLWESGRRIGGLGGR